MTNGPFSPYHAHLIDEDSAIFGVLGLSQHIDSQVCNARIFAVARALGFPVISTLHHSKEIVQSFHLDGHHSSPAGRRNNRRKNAPIILGLDRLKKKRNSVSKEVGLLQKNEEETPTPFLSTEHFPSPAFCHFYGRCWCQDDHCGFRFLFGCLAKL